MLASLSKAFRIYSKRPFNFAWGSLLCVFLLLAFAFACIGLFMIYFLISSVLGISVSTDSIPTLIAAGAIIILFMFFANGINAALAVAYREAFNKQKTNLLSFYSYALNMAPTMFVIMLIRDLLWLLLVGPAFALYELVLKSHGYMDMLLLLYVLIVTFTIHLLFTPAFLSAGAFGTNTYASLRRTTYFLRNKHINFIGLYILFAIAWLLNFIPLLQIVSIFFLYPVIYTAMIAMLEGGARAPKPRGREEGDDE